MKTFLTLIFCITLNINSIQAANTAAGVLIYPAVESAGGGAADAYWYNVLGGISTTTTTSFNPTTGLVLILDNDEASLNIAAPEVQEALEREELGLELNELDIAILDKLDELNQ